MRTVAIIPARLESKRLPRKVLREILGRPLIQHVYERVQRARRVDEVHVATDSAEVEQACRAFTPRVVRSRIAHPSGTDRVAEVARSIEADVVINVQCDEPMMDPEVVDGVVELFGDPGVAMASAANPIRRVEDLLDPNVVKVVIDRRGDALYFSRAPIPWSRDAPPRGTGPLPAGALALNHVGIYGYRRACLLALAELEQTPLELLESLEQLRAQEHGIKIRMLQCAYRGVDIDTEDDLELVRAMLERESRSPSPPR